MTAGGLTELRRREEADALLSHVALKTATRNERQCNGLYTKLFPSLPRMKMLVHKIGFDLPELSVYRRIAELLIKSLAGC